MHEDTSTSKTGWLAPVILVPPACTPARRAKQPQRKPLTGGVGKSNMALVRPAEESDEERGATAGGAGRRPAGGREWGRV